MRPENIALIVLASGLSKRFGAPNKLMADLSDRPVLAHVMDFLAPINFAARFAVTPQDPNMIHLLEDAGYECIVNLDPKRGQGRSIALGAQAALQQGHHAALVVLGDMPFVETSHILHLIKISTDNDIIMSEYKRVHMPPAVFKGSAFTNLLSLEGDQGGKSASRRKSAVTAALSPRAAQDIDTFEDLRIAAKGLN